MIALMNGALVYYRGGETMSAGNDKDANASSEDQDDLEDDDDFDPAEYNTLLQLERLESLEEEMSELGVTSLADIRRRIEDLNAQLDAEHNG